MKPEVCNARGPILMIGRRRRAIAAAERCGWEPVVIDVPPRDEQAPGAFGGSADWAVDKACELFPDSPPAAVAAVATGAVVAAAVARDHFGLPGISRATALRCHDKLAMKKAISAAGIPCAPWRETSADTTTDELVAELGLPLVLKLPISSGGRGVWVCQTAAEVSERIVPGLLAEGFVSGTEMSVETFRADGRTLFRNPTRYLKPRWANIVPASLEPLDMALVAELGEQVHEALEIHGGITHMEVFLTELGPVFGEIAARPPGGYLMELIEYAYGFDPWEAVLRIATGEVPAFPAEAKQFAGVWLIHPGPGRIIEIGGLEDARSVRGVIDLSCKVRPGDVVAARIGSGETKGRMLATATTHSACADALAEAVDKLRFSLVPAQSGSTDRSHQSLEVATG